jgi:MraZ protein
MYQHTLDAKGRVTLPAAFREQLAGAELPKISISFDGRCAAIYPRAAWRDLLARLKALPRTDSHAESVRRVLLSLSFDLEVDRQGRAVIPPRLREQVGIVRDVTLVGSIELVEVWDRAKWAEVFENGRSSLAADAGRLSI